MEHSTQPRASRRYHTDPVFDRVLAVFFEQGHDQLGPSFLAYELDLTTRAAEEILDGMVKHSLLELDFDDHGSLYYSLNSDVLFEMEQRSAPASNDWSALKEQSASSRPVGPQGFDGTTGQGVKTGRPSRHNQSRHNQSRRNQPRRQHPSHAAPAVQDGCDGTVGHPGDSTQHASLDGHPGRPYRSQQTHQQSPRDAQYRSGPRGEARSSNGELVRQTQSNLPARRRNTEPMVAALLSVLLVGTGQIYNRDVGKGIAFFVAYAVLLTTFFPIGWMINVWAAVDAYSSAQRRNAETT